MLYLFDCHLIYKDRKKKLTFKENFTIPFTELADQLDIELLYLENSEFGKYIEKKTEFLAKGTITLSLKLGQTINHWIDVSILLDYTNPFKKV